MDVDQNDAKPAATAAGCYTLVAKYGKTQHTLENLPETTTVLEVKKMLSEQTRILPKRQKLIGLASTCGKLCDETPLSQIKTKRKSSNAKSMSFILMGTPEEDILVDPSERDDLPEVIDDFDLDFNAGSSEVSCCLLIVI